MVHHPRETGKMIIKTDRCTKFRLNFGTSVCFVYFLLPSFFFPISSPFFSPFSLPFSLPSRSHLATQTFLSKSVYQRADSFLFSGKHLATHTFSAKTMYQDQTRRHRDLNRPSERGKSLVEFEMARVETRRQDCRSRQDCGLCFFTIFAAVF